MIHTTSWAHFCCFFICRLLLLLQLQLQGLAVRFLSKLSLYTQKIVHAEMLTALPLQQAGLHCLG